MNERVALAYKQQPRKWIANIALAIIILFFVAISFTGSTINWYRLANFSQSFNTMIRGVVDINWAFFFGIDGFQFSEGIVYKTLETLAMAFLGTMIGAVLALPFGFLAAVNVVGKKWAKVSEALLVLIRVFPEIILAIILIKGFGMTPLTGVLTIGIHSIGMLGKLFAEAIDNMDRSSLEALDSVGASTWQKILYGIIPNIMPDLTSVSLYRFDINVRSASILGIIGAGGIGAPLLIAANNWSWNMLGTVLLAIILMVLAVDFISSYLRNKLV
jgi:phosphonate transport system permease protein